MIEIPDWSKAAAASQQIAAFLVDTYRDRGGVHAETVIAAAAALAGNYAMRSIGQLPPGNRYVVHSDVSDLMFTGSKTGNALTNVVLTLAEKTGVPRAQFPDPTTINQHVITAFGSNSYPPLTVPRRNYPREWSPNATVRLAPQIDRLLFQYDLSPLEAAMALAMATGGLIQMTAEALDPRIGVKLALEIMIGVSKMRPLEREIGPDSGPGPSEPEPPPPLPTDDVPTLVPDPEPPAATPPPRLPAGTIPPPTRIFGRRGT